MKMRGTHKCDTRVGIFCVLKSNYNKEGGEGDETMIWGLKKKININKLDRFHV